MGTVGAHLGHISGIVGAQLGHKISLPIVDVILNSLHATIFISGQRGPVIDSTQQLVLLINDTGDREGSYMKDRGEGTGPC